MTNKLEEVFKELQESHVLVDREEYEQLVEKAKEAELEKIAKFEVGDFFFDKDGINKTIGIEPYLTTRGYCIETGMFFDKFWANAEDARKATDEEIKLFKRAEMYHKHGRKLDELKVGDFVKKGKTIYQITKLQGQVQLIIDGGYELYLTLEGIQEAHKKIVGE
ncbi:hypothetical protein BN424_2641 [Carnobacterium maltaromaticum LMA28]|uniref:Uncharacterized protein n=1 Tax=Carnobacterium maltaromaticum LMA28 TaxID=1234679 RepID=K8E5Q2_CARML|nr:hypothetical protein [Carnobacterium maltaromaticum]CCO12080.2 hypothetical protein BN424_2641 [Carnobacterium maltaromaticum LMA28]